MELTWIDGSTSWFWVKAGGKTIHIDPSYHPRDHARGPEMNDKADLVLVTHSHGDHFQKETVTELLDKGTILIAPENVVSKLGRIENVKMAEPGIEHDLGWAKIKAVHAYNRGFKGHFLHRKSKCVGYLVTIDGKTLYHAGDTDLIPEMREARTCRSGIASDRWHVHHGCRRSGRSCQGDRVKIGRSYAQSEDTDQRVQDQVGQESRNSGHSCRARKALQAILIHLRRCRRK